MVKHQGNFGNWLRGRQDNQSHFYNRHTKELRELYKGQAIYVQDLERKTRSPAKVVDQGNTPRSYTVEAETSVHLRRNRIHLRPNNSSNNPANNSSTSIPQGSTTTLRMPMSSNINSRDPTSVETETRPTKSRSSREI